MTSSNSRRIATSANNVVPIQIVKPVEVEINQGEGQDPGKKINFTLDENALQTVLTKKDVQNLPVVVISIAGDYRKGKSFMLSFFLRCLQAKTEGKDNWMGWDDHQNFPESTPPLEGFSWKSGSKGHTQGIWIWPQVFKVKNSAGQDVAVILMDTQGTLDNAKSDRECATVFALSTMLSSVQIFNLKGNIQKNDLQYLQLFVSYGMQALEKYTEEPFQTLYFLIRDWSSPHEYSYGKMGGQMLVEERLGTTMGEETEQFRLNKNIRKCFKTISCFLTPHPGKIVSTSADYKGSLSDIDPEFLEHAKNFVEDVLSPENLVARYIDGNVVHVKDLTNYFQSYLKVFNGNEVPNIQSITTANAEANLANAVRNAEDYYKTEMTHLFEQEELNTVLLHSKHEEINDEAMKRFQAAKCLDDGYKTLRQRYKTDLMKRIENSLREYKVQLEKYSLLQHQTGYNEAIDSYDKKMNELFPLSGPYVDERTFCSGHEKIKALAIRHFSNPPKWEKETHNQKYMNKLLQEVARLYTEHKRINDDKHSISNIIKAFFLWFLGTLFSIARTALSAAAAVVGAVAAAVAAVRAVAAAVVGAVAAAAAVVGAVAAAVVGAVAAAVAAVGAVAAAAAVKAAVGAAAAGAAKSAIVTAAVAAANGAVAAIAAAAAPVIGVGLAVCGIYYAMKYAWNRISIIRQRNS